MKNKHRLSEILSFLNPEIAERILEESSVAEIPENTEIIKEGQYVKVIPIVMEGLIKVFSRHDEKELLLYYIRPGESCIMSFAAGLKNEPSKIVAVSEENTTMLLLPAHKIAGWIKQFPDLNSLFYQQYNLRYSELLDTINHILFNKLDSRLYDYLREKVALTGNNPLKISHRQIANELGTVREVISRILKKLELDGKVKQHVNGIEIIGM